MNLKWIMIGTGVVLILAVAGLLISGTGSSGAMKGREGESLMQGVDMTDAASIVIRKGKEQVALSTSPTGWVVDNIQRFPADQVKLNNLIIDLMDEKVGHRISGKREKLATLGLLMPGEEGAGKETGTSLSIRDASGKSLYELVLGNNRKSSSTSAYGGQYVRLDNEMAAYLIRGSPTLQTDGESWLDLKLLTLDKADIKTLRITPSKGKAAVFTRAGADVPWTIAGAPAAEFNNDMVNDIVEKFGELEFFKLADPGAAPSALGRSRLATVAADLFDGRAYTVQIGDTMVEEEIYYISASASLIPSVTDEELRAKVDQFNERFRGRVFGMYDFDAAPLLKTRKDFLQVTQ